MLSVLLFLFSQAHAIEGQFTFKGDNQVLSATRYETVYTPSEQGKIRLKELMDEGYACQPKLQFVQCSLSFENQPMPAVDFSPAVTEVYFDKVTSLTPIYEGTHFVQSEAEQDVTVLGLTYPTATYYDLKDVAKVTVGDPNKTDYHSFVIHPDSVSYVGHLSVTESKWVFMDYWIESILTKN